ncbi:FAD-dependent thymidylate synthase [Thermincola potens]|nr:FAD-dependent thymidylate synthase [Thermincola potens]
MMKVKLINYTPDPDKTVAAAARLCYSPIGAEDLLDNLTDQEVAKFLNILVRMGHWSPIEHVTFTFAIEGVSRALSHQLVRHRIASYSQQSQRYVKFEDFAYVIPPSVKNNPEAEAIFTRTMKIINEAYKELADLVHHEDARYVLPNACETKLVATLNARSLYNFFRHRCCERAQWEIRKLANLMLAEVRRVAPILFSNAGPDCITQGICHEGKMSCGRLEKIKAAEKGN